ncbi:MAG: M4 family metallopeptidase [Bacteroidota bacterium]
MRPLLILFALMLGIPLLAQKATAILVDHLQTVYGPDWQRVVPAEYDYLRTTTGPGGEIFHRYQVLYEQVPVLGRTLTAKLSPTGNVLHLSGNLSPLPDLAPAAAPPLPPATLAQNARRALVPTYPYAQQWTVTDQGAFWTSRNPWQGGILYRTRALEVSEPAGHRAEMVYVESTTGKVILHYPLHCSLNRRLYRSNVSGAAILWNEGDIFPGDLNAEGQEMLTTTKETYHLFDRTFGRESYDGENAQLRCVSDVTFSRRPPDFGCPNARAANGAIYHCRGVVSDDIVGHEWTHNYMTEMNGIIYQFESGAISEAYADIFGEIIDLLNTRGNDTGDDLLRTDCDDAGLRWKLGEDATAIDTIIRDLWQPECRDDPSSRWSEDYACLDITQDNGGVHINSGVVNRAFSLLTDGGTLRGDTVTGIGMTKAAHLFFHAADKYLTPVTDFDALGMLLQLSVHDLIGKPLSALTLVDLPAPYSGDTINAFDSLQLAKVIRATGLLDPTPCSTLPTLGQEPPEICATPDAPDLVSFLAENWENGLPDNWTVTETPVHPSTWDPKPWASTDMLPNGRPGRGLLAPNSRYGDCRSDLDNGTTELTSPPVVAPVDQTGFVLRFDHYYAIEAPYDGGILMYSINEADFTQVPEEAFIYNGYDGALAGPGDNDNPLAGRLAFQGADRNSTTGTWGTSIVDLSQLGLVGGDALRLRWTLGHDGCDGWLGWYLDDVRVGYCGELALPVVYRSFMATADKDHIRLDWATATEDRNAGYYVERRAGDTFAELGFVPAGAEYVFRDYEVVPGREYVYRLRQTDVDGSVAYSTLVRAALMARLRVLPNPAADVVRVVVPPGVEWVDLHDLSGRPLGRQRAGAGEVVFELAGLSAGVYFIRAGNSVERLIVC